MPQYRVTQRVYGYRRYLVSSRGWKDAKRKVERACHADIEVPTAELPRGVILEDSGVDDPHRWYFGEVVFVDSADGRESFYEV